jgi:hypothetical protein
VVDGVLVGGPRRGRPDDVQLEGPVGGPVAGLAGFQPDPLDVVVPQQVYEVVHLCVELLDGLLLDGDLRADLLQPRPCRVQFVELPVEFRTPGAFLLGFPARGLQLLAFPGQNDAEFVTTVRLSRSSGTRTPASGVTGSDKSSGAPRAVR